MMMVWAHPNPHAWGILGMNMEGSVVHNNIRRRATLGLLFVTIIWGWTFIWMKQATNFAEEFNPNLSDQWVVIFFVLLRFSIAAILLIALYPPCRAGLSNPEVLRGGAWLGLIVWAGFLTQMLGIPNITPAVSAFLTSLYVVFTALIGVALGRQKMTKIMLIGVLLATFGAGWISGPPQLEFGIPEWLTIFGALMFAAHILATDRITKKVDAHQLTGVMLLSVAIISTALFLIITPFIGSYTDLGNLFSLLLETNFLIPLLCCSILGSLVALLVLNLFQQYLSPIRAAILYALEPVWATIFGIILDLEPVTIWLCLGGTALLVGNLAVELTGLNYIEQDLEQE